MDYTSKEVDNLEREIARIRTEMVRLDLEAKESRRLGLNTTAKVQRTSYNCLAMRLEALMDKLDRIGG